MRRVVGGLPDEMNGEEEVVVSADVSSSTTHSSVYGGRRSSAMASALGDVRQRFPSGGAQSTILSANGTTAPAGQEVYEQRRRSGKAPRYEEPEDDWDPLQGDKVDDSE